MGWPLLLLLPLLLPLPFDDEDSESILLSRKLDSFERLARAAAGKGGREGEGQDATVPSTSGAASSLFKLMRAFCFCSPRFAILNGRTGCCYGGTGRSWVHGTRSALLGTSTPRAFPLAKHPTLEAATDSE